MVEIKIIIYGPPPLVGYLFSLKYFEIYTAFHYIRVPAPHPLAHAYECSLICRYQVCAKVSASLLRRAFSCVDGAQADLGIKTCSAATRQNNSKGKTNDTGL